WGFWSIATTKVICYRYFPSRWKIGLRCSSRSSNAKARRVSGKETSRRCLKHWRKSRSVGEISKGRRIDNAVLPQVRRDAAEASYLVSSKRGGADLQERRHRLRARHHDGRFQRSLLDHVSPSSAYACPER